MTNHHRPKKKKKLTITASERGVEKAEKALIRLGLNSKSNFAKSRLLSRGTVTKFFNQQPIQLDLFKKICQELKLNWREVAPIEEEGVKLSTINDYNSLEKNDEVEQLQPILQSNCRRVTVIDETHQIIKAKIILEGDIDSVGNLKILESILQEYSGNTIKIIDVKEGSIRLTLEGIQCDCNFINFNDIMFICDHHTTEIYSTSYTYSKSD
ncbi:MAG: hypothetical protein F6K58_05930 [Symploca sp. SIO2E9]|nr:hypothetical protein [Symploca sp. SIO2E9]